LRKSKKNSRKPKKKQKKKKKETIFQDSLGRAPWRKPNKP
jgi:DNA recombination-dependent growth factor C